MTFDPQKPRYTLPLAGKEYELEGSFAVIEAAERALQDNIFSISRRCPSMPAHEMAKLLSAIMGECGHKLSATEIGKILWNEVGVFSQDYLLLSLHVNAFLRITIAKPAERQEVEKQAGEDLRKFQPSPGDGIGASA